ncbi:MAG: hypothetical protein AAF802_32700 [Planctomycetota bacterium]
MGKGKTPLSAKYLVAEKSELAITIEQDVQQDKLGIEKIRFV